MFDECPIGDLIANQVGGGTPSRQVPSYWNGPIPWASVKDFTNGDSVISSTQENITVQGLSASASNLIPAGTPMICTRMAVGRSAFASMDVAINQDVKALQPKVGTSRDYLLRLLRFVRPRAEAAAVGSTVKGIRIQDFLSILAPIAPAEEQSCIAEILTSLDTTICQTEAIIEKLKQVKQGLLHDLLTRGIDANGELRPPQSQARHLYKDSPLGWIPKEWELAPLLDRVDLAQGQVDPKMEPYRNWILIAPDHIESGTGRLLGEVTALDQGAISGKYLCKPGDVIYSKIRPYLRKAIIVEKYALCSADMYPFTSHDSVNPQFLLSLLLGDAFSRFAESVSMRTGMPKINREELAEYRVAWPCRKEQDAITDCLMSMVHKQEAALMELTKLVELRGGLMEDLLTGRVRVTPLLNS